MGSLERRLRALEERPPALPPSDAAGSFAEEVRAIDAEIRELERELKARGIDPAECLREVSVDLPLDEHIEMLEAEIALEEVEG